MAYFHDKTIQGVNYTLLHLEPFSFKLKDGDVEHDVHVIFRSHCFTEGLKPTHTPDYHYTHSNETRGFCLTRYAQSKHLPELVQAMGNRSVYKSRGGANHFFLGKCPVTGASGPYFVVFHLTKARTPRTGVLMTVESAYLKAGMTEFASPVRFTTLVSAAASGKKISYGPAVQIKRK